jgi:hypothetical protein
MCVKATILFGPVVRPVSQLPEKSLAIAFVLPIVPFAFARGRRSSREQACRGLPLQRMRTWSVICFVMLAM